MSNEIILLSEIEAVRKNPGMYIGSVCEAGAHHLLFELVHNAIDEAMLGFCSNIRVTLAADFCEVKDNGRGIPTKMHATEGVSSLEVALTRLHAGSKFNKTPGQFTAGLHGVGLSCVNALSTRLRVQVERDGELSVQEFERGKALFPLRREGAAKTTGTSIRFQPDGGIFTGFLRFNEERCLDFLESLAFLNPHVEISFKNEMDGTERSFHLSSGLPGLLHKAVATRRRLFPETIELASTQENFRFHAALTWTAESEPVYSAFVNCVPTVNGGTHVNAFRAGVATALARVARHLGRTEFAMEMAEVTEGLVVAIDCKVVAPDFDGQTKSRLTNAELLEPVERAVADQLTHYLLQNPKTASIVLARIHEARNARAAARRASERIYFAHGRREINEEVYKEQFGARSKNWHDSAVWITDQTLLQAHADLCQVSTDAIALDVCCGSGVVGAAFRPKVKKIVGLDLTPEMAKLAAQRLDEVHLGNVYNIPFSDSSFDLVCTREVLHLLPYPDRPVSEIFRVLKPGGQFVVGQILPFGSADAAWMYRVFKKKQPLIFNMFQEDDFRRLLSGAGFVDLEMKELNVWESIDVWINSYETTALHRHEIRDLFLNAPAEAKAIHPFRILADGGIEDLWRWCIFSVRKPLT